MIFKSPDIRRIFGAAALCLTGACGLLVTPPDDYPPKQDLTAPDSIRNVSADLVIAERYGATVPALQVVWDNAPETDVLYYTIERELEGSKEVIAALLKPQDRYTDTHIGFPGTESGSRQYIYRIAAIDSAGNRSAAGDADTVSLVMAPVLHRPQGSGTDVRPLFDWEVRFNTGKDFRFCLMRSTDTLILSDFSVAGYDVMRIRKTFQELRDASSVTAPDSLEQGSYSWWVSVTLTPEIAGIPSRKGLAVQEFIIE